MFNVQYLYRYTDISSFFQYRKWYDVPHVAGTQMFIDVKGVNTEGRNANFILSLSLFDDHFSALPSAL